MGPSRAATLKEIVQEMNVGTMFDTKGEVRNPFKLSTSFLVDIFLAIIFLSSDLDCSPCPDISTEPGLDQ